MSVVCQFQGAVAEIVFRSPSGVHTFGADTRRELGDALDRIESAAPRVVVFRAEGRTFLAGADLKELAALPPDQAADLTAAAHRLMNRIAALPAVTIVAIHAPCLGGGLELALACDLRIAAASAKLGTPEVALGLIPGWGGTIRLASMFGTAVARKLVLTGDLVTAEQAHRLGLVDELVPDEALQTTVEQLVGRLLSRGPQAQVRAKRLLSQWDAERQQIWLDRESEAFVAALTGAESSEGIAAFLEKRPPRWPDP